VREADLLGMPVDQATRLLERKGLAVTTEQWANDGGREPGTVANVDPVGRLAPGSTVTLDVWAERPKPEPEKKKPDKGRPGHGPGHHEHGDKKGKKK
jgi:beta-lactam-binding protein with PASTA domain